MDPADRTPVRPRGTAGVAVRATAAAVLAVSFLLLAGCGGAGGGQDDATPTVPGSSAAACFSPGRANGGPGTLARAICRAGEAISAHTGTTEGVPAHRAAPAA